MLLSKNNVACSNEIYHIYFSDFTWFLCYDTWNHHGHGNADSHPIRSFSVWKMENYFIRNYVYMIYDYTYVCVCGIICIARYETAGQPLFGDVLGRHVKLHVVHLWMVPRMSRLHGIVKDRTAHGKRQHWTKDLRVRIWATDGAPISSQNDQHLQFLSICGVYKYPFLGFNWWADAKAWCKRLEKTHISNIFER